MKLRGGEFSTGTMGNFQPELTKSPNTSPVGCEHLSTHSSQSPRWPQTASQEASKS